MNPAIPAAASVPGAARRHAQALAAALLARTWQPLCEAVAHVARRHRLARMQATLAALDEATLRDVGLQRNEAARYWAQAEGLAPPNDPRIVRRAAASHRPYLRPVMP